MHSVLKKLHVLPGVIGGLLADADGSLLAHSFPPLFDVSAMQGVCLDVNNTLAGMQDATGGVRMLDLRFEHGRLIVKQMPTYVLLLLCEHRVNFQLLLITMNVATKNLEQLVDKKIDSKPADLPHPMKADIYSTRLKEIVEESMATGMV